MAGLTPPQFDALSARLQSLDVTGLSPLPGGASSVTLVGQRDGQRVVVKVAPPGKAPTLNRDVLRQAYVIRALGPSGVPLPEVLLEDAGDPPEVPPLFAMSFLDGTSVEPLFDRDVAPVDTDVMAERLRAAARVLARLHRVDPASVGLAAEPVVTPAEEVARWCRLLETVDPTLVPGWQDVAAQLRDSVPTALRPAIVHGDFRLGNCLADGTHVTAVIDWEIWSIGDPRVDLGWFLINGDPATYRRETPHSGCLPTPSELTEVYGTDVPRLAWFQGLACFKSAATWSLIVKHDRRRVPPDPQFEEMAGILPWLLARAEHFIKIDAGQGIHADGER
ncbi:aminoglycoside phosphotransferase [Mycolicibacterium madagascariense]|uniref:Aminoglycoside phosphotransferase n=1 Tax=Mycolicibacterium madagascariense TaxID=212765 RepID=A0A7I7XDQ3_9MYCO|nr:phosphotransferase family protein [Mycolicibacterium madagascariense]MCV7015698.1 phosphotransferase family protein [Mycolicibacterium madagascariense]BBZ27113.1 aminoglycoside phosphotransferase [Mycolicibacterium madagascariense]